MHASKQTAYRTPADMSEPLPPRRLYLIGSAAHDYDIGWRTLALGSWGVIVLLLAVCYVASGAVSYVARFSHVVAVLALAWCACFVRYGSRPPKGAYLVAAAEAVR